jgi:hypothetical protein
MPSIEQKYAQWRADYVRSWGDLIYIDYNKKGEVEQANAITCSEGNFKTPIDHKIDNGFNGPWKKIANITQRPWS